MCFPAGITKRMTSSTLVFTNVVVVALASAEPSGRISITSPDFACGTAIVFLLRIKCLHYFRTSSKYVVEWPIFNQRFAVPSLFFGNTMKRFINYPNSWRNTIVVRYNIDGVGLKRTLLVSSAVSGSVERSQALKLASALPCSNLPR